MIIPKGLAAATLICLSSLAGADTWTFVVAGDGRTNDVTPDPSGINLPVFSKLVSAIQSEHPKFLLYTGDLVHGIYGKVTAPVDQQLATWKRAIGPLAGVTILPVRGNHESYGDQDGKAWLKQMKPLVDAAHVTYFKGEVGFSYSFSPKNDPALVVIAVDQFIHEHRVNLGELESALERANRSGAKNIIVFAHEMAFTCASHGDNENMAKFKSDRDTFLELLEMYGVRYFFAGHDHTYDWMEIKSSKWAANYTLNQIVAGTAGAPFYKDRGYYGDHDGYDLVRREHLDNTYGYLVVTVDDGEALKVTFKSVQP